MTRILGLCLLSTLLACGTSTPEPSEATNANAQADHEMGADGEMSEHCKNHPAPEPTSYARSEHGYTLPELALTDHHDKALDMATLANPEGPLVVNFIFATCTTICPVMSATFARTQEALGDDAGKLQFVSISIDPEHDTPAVLAEYAQKYDAGDNWRFVTGDSKDVEQVLKAFDAWNGSKFSHEALTLLRRPDQEQWVRLEGLGNATELSAEIRKTLLAEPVL